MESDDKSQQKEILDYHPMDGVVRGFCHDPYVSILIMDII
jgi:hypothetical protein